MGVVEAEEEEKVLPGWRWRLRWSLVGCARLQSGPRLVAERLQTGGLVSLVLQQLGWSGRTDLSEDPVCLPPAPSPLAQVYSDHQTAGKHRKQGMRREQMIQIQLKITTTGTETN